MSPVRWGLFGVLTPTGALRFGAGLVAFDLPTNVSIVAVDARLSGDNERAPRRLAADSGERLWHVRFNLSASPFPILSLGRLQAYGSAGIDAVKEPNGPWLVGHSWAVGARRTGTHQFLPILEWRWFVRTGWHFGSLIVGTTHPMGFP